MLATGCLMILLATVASARTRNFADDEHISFGNQLIQLDGGCVSIRGTIASGDFFDGLTRRDDAGTIEFKKHGKSVTKYPETVTASIRILGAPCAASDSSSPVRIFYDGSYSVGFDLKWKRDMEMRPAALSSAAANCTGYSSITNLAENISEPAVSCDLTVRSQGVPLGDHLIVSIFDSQGRFLTRISAAP